MSRLWGDVGAVLASAEGAWQVTLMIWVCVGCGERWELEPGVEPKRDNAGNPLCRACWTEHAGRI